MISPDNEQSDPEETGELGEKRAFVWPWQALWRWLPWGRARSKPEDDPERLLPKDYKPEDELSAHLELMKLAWSSFDRRRDFEWKVALGLWTALAAFIGLVLTGDTSHDIRIPIATGIAAILIFLLYVNWCRGLGEANNADRNLQYFYERRILGLLDIRFSSTVKEGFAALGRHMGLLSNWSPMLQYGVTLVLCIGAVGATVATYAEEDESTSRIIVELQPSPTATPVAQASPSTVGVPANAP